MSSGLDMRKQARVTLDANDDGGDLCRLEI